MSTHTKTQKTVALVNPWSGAEAPDQVLTWPQITGWAAINIHADSRKEWLGQAREAFRDNDGETLGSMIIGS